MMPVVIHLLWTVLACFVIFSYASVAYVSFVYQDEEYRSYSLAMKVFIWLLSPLVLLDIVLEKIFGWSFMS